MRFNSQATKCVVFLGYPDYAAGPNAIRCEGTGFLLIYKGGFYLVTARHVAESLGDIGWATRVNKRDGSCALLEAANVAWIFHPDSTVDIAICGFHISAEEGFDFLYADAEFFLLKREEEISLDWVEVGDVCYTAGLWRLLAGNERNLPVVHTGNIARLAGQEKIPVRAVGKPGNRELVDGYLVEAQTLSGLSGSPVFIRPSVNLGMDAHDLDKPEPGNVRLELVAYRGQVKLLGLWQAAWDAPAGEVLTAEHGRQTTVPVGMGIVVPSSKIIEVLELPITREKREALKKMQEQQGLVGSQSTENSASPPSNGESPAH
jgi:hypothetical protein